MAGRPGENFTRLNSVGDKDFSTGALTGYYCSYLDSWGNHDLWTWLISTPGGLGFIISLLGTSIGLLLTGLVTVRMGEF